MNIDIYSDRAKQAVQSAQSLALARRHQQFAPEHLLKALLEEKDGLARQLIQSAGGRPEAAASETEALLAKTPKVEGGNGQLYLKPETARVFAKAEALSAVRPLRMVSAAASSPLAVTPAFFRTSAAGPPSAATAASSRSVVTKESPLFLASSSALAKTRAVSGFR